MQQQQQYPKIIELNVGGKYYATTLVTLQRYPNSMLARMFSGNFATTQDKDGRYFLDRNGDAFGVILDYLRTGNLFIPPNLSREQIYEEAQYYCIDPLVSLLTNNPTSNTSSTSPLASPKSPIMSRNSVDVIHDAFYASWRGSGLSSFEIFWPTIRDGFAKGAAQYGNRGARIFFHPGLEGVQVSNDGRTASVHLFPFAKPIALIWYEELKKERWIKCELDYDKPSIELIWF
jgi:hypothetical protein